MKIKDQPIRFQLKRHICVQSWRMFVLAAATIGIFLSISILPINAASGDLDPTFGIGGKVVTVLPQNNDPRKIAIQPDGKIVLQGGNYNDGDNSEVDFLARYNPNGTLDTSFGLNGTAVIPYQTQPLESLRDGPVILPDGKILVGGNRYIGTEDRFVFMVIRFNANGSLDTSFGNSGSAVASFGSQNNRFDTGENMLVQPDGKIVLAGYAEQCFQAFEYYCSVEGVGVVRFNTDGSIDNTFGSAGKAVLQGAPLGVNYISDFVALPDGKLLLIGLGGFQVFLNRINPNGTLDATFGTNGVLLPDIDSTQVDIYRMAIQPDGKIIFPVANNRHSPVFSTIVRLNADGTPDASFGTNGKVVIPWSEGLFYDPILVQPNGKIVIGGCALSSDGPPLYFALTHLNADGSRDTAFGSNGTVTSLLASYGGCVSDLALQPDGKLIAVGGVQTYESDLDIGLVRFLPTSAPAVEISGKVATPDGRGLRNATVTLTDPLGVRRTATTSSFGFYTFSNVPAAETYLIGVSSRLYRFASRNLVINDNLTNVDFVGLE